MREENDCLQHLDEMFGPADVIPRDTDPISIDEFVLENISQKDPRASDEEFRKARKKEVVGLQERNLRRIVKTKIDKDYNILGGRFILSLKSFGTPNEMVKVRFVAKGLDDRHKPFMVHDTSTLRSSSIQLIISNELIYNFRIFFHDFTQAYLQS